VSSSPARPDPFAFDVSGRPALPRLRGLFVTGTDTGVGKTLIAGAVARHLRKRGLVVEVFKPVATGCRRGRGTLISADAEFLAACAESRRTLEEITPLRYATAVAPNVAAARERRPIDLAKLFDAYGRLEGTCDAVIVEGVGGLLCPIRDDFWVIHLARMMRLPVVIVAQAGLGTINHTLLTLYAARAAGLHVAGVVINRYEMAPSARAALDSVRPPGARGDAEMAMYTNPGQIEDRGRTEVLAIVPADPASSVERAAVGPDTQFAVSQADWRGVIFGRGRLRAPPAKGRATD